MKLDGANGSLDTVVGCAFPGCTHRVLFLEGHHIKHRADGGETSLLNTALLCSLHHRYVHEYRYTIELGPDQRPPFRNRYGLLVPAVPAPPDSAGLGWQRISQANAILTISPETPACEWDGSPVDYNTMIHHLLIEDDLA